jgi:Tol biopolymer transport system component
VTGGLSQLTDNSASDTYPSWSPDGSKLAFQSDQDGDYESPPSHITRVLIRPPRGRPMAARLPFTRRLMATGISI